MRRLADPMESPYFPNGSFQIPPTFNPNTPPPPPPKHSSHEASRRETPQAGPPLPPPPPPTQDPNESLYRIAVDAQMQRPSEGTSTANLQSIPLEESWLPQVLRDKPYSPEIRSHLVARPDRSSLAGKQIYPTSFLILPFKPPSSMHRAQPTQPYHKPNGL